MELRKIDTLEELVREKIRLRREAKAAGDLLRRQTVKALSSGKSAITGSWKATLPFIAVAAAKKFVDRSADAITAPFEDNPTFNSIGESLKIFQRNDSPRWMALVPMLKHLWEKWIQTAEPEEPADVTSPSGHGASQPSSQDDRVTASAEPVGAH